LVHLRRITADNEQECLGLRVHDAQARFVASNVQPLTQAKTNPGLVPLAVYDQAARGYPQPRVPMVGFVMYEIDGPVLSHFGEPLKRTHLRAER
jgi:diamine N-acetyltransferase